MKNQVVCYTYISGCYDSLRQHTYTTPNWDYICFTNNPKLLEQKSVGVWKIVKSKFEKLDPKRNSGWHKTHPHILFPEYKKSVWIDSNIDVLTNYLENTLKYTKKHLFVPIHYERDCIYDEIKEVKDTDHDTPKKCDQALNFLISKKMPRKYGLNETNIMLRYHNDIVIKSIDNIWWNCITKYSKRDQLSFSYCLFKHNIKVKNISFPNARIDKVNFNIVGHNYPEGKKVLRSIFRKERLPNGRRHIYLCGLKIASYNTKHKYLYDKKYQTNIPKLLVYTCANEDNFPFAILYPLFVLQTNKNVAIEIAIENYKKFITDYGYLLDWYNKNYPDTVYFHPFVKSYKCKFGTTRFITQPLWRGKYVYIGDVDIMITQEIAQQHINNIKKHGLDFSNIKRKGENKLSGLHFIEYDKMYPIKIPHRLNLMKVWDEEVLYFMMKGKMYKIPDENICNFRPILGMHFSYYSRPPLPTLTTKDEIVTDFPSWFNNSTNRITKDSYMNVKKYLDVRYSDTVKDFMKNIHTKHILLRKIIQYMDMSCWYFLYQNNLNTKPD